MPSPLAHIGLALALRAGVLPDSPVLLADRWPVRGAMLAAFASLAPDLDVLPMLIDPAGIVWHRGPSHSVVGALLIGLGIAVLGGLRGRERVATVLAALMHVPLDWSTGLPGTPARYGVPWMWPLSDEKFISAQPWFGAFGIDGPSGLGAMWAVEAGAIYGKEALTVAVAGLVVWAVRNYR